MRKIDFLQIGNYSSDPEGKLIRITIKPDLKDALIKLDHFSHCLVFTKEDCSFHCYTARIVNISEKTGEVLIESDIGLEGELVDIKPYFPCEEKADGYVKDTELGDKYLEPLYLPTSIKMQHM